MYFESILWCFTEKAKKSQKLKGKMLQKCNRFWFRVLCREVHDGNEVIVRPNCLVFEPSQKKFYKNCGIPGFSLNKTMKSIIIQVNSDNSHEYECTLILSSNSLKDTVVMKKGDNLFNLVQSKLELFFLERPQKGTFH